MTVQKYSDLTVEERRAHVDTLLNRWRTEGMLERVFGFQPRTFLPVPWHGRVRQWLSGWLFEWAETIESWGHTVNYRPRLKYPPAHLNTGSTISFRKWAPLTTTKEYSTDAQE